MPSITSLSDALNEIIRLKGEEILANRELVLSMISDIAPKLKVARLQLQIVISSGVWDKLLKAKKLSNNEKLRVLSQSKNILISLGIEKTIAEDLLLNISEGISLGCASIFGESNAQGNCNSEAQPISKGAIHNNNSVNISALLRRGFLALEDNDLDKADIFF